MPEWPIDSALPFVDRFTRWDAERYQFGGPGPGDFAVSSGALGQVNLVVGPLVVKDLQLSNASVSFDFNYGANRTGGTGAVLRYLDSQNYLLARHTTSALDLFKVDGGVATNLGTHAIVTVANSVYWLQFEARGNTLRAQFFTSDPTTDIAAAPAYTATAILSGADAIKFGSGVSGKCGTWWSLGDTGYRMDDLTIVAGAFQ